MPDSRDIRSGKDLKLQAVFVPQDAAGQASTHNTAISLGPYTLRLPAVFVPEGSSPPGYPYVHFGNMTFDQDADDNAGQTTLPGSKAAGPTGAPQQGMPPSPLGVADGPNPVAAGTADWGSRNAGSTGRQNSAPMDPAPDDQHTPPDGVVGRAASLTSSYVDTANAASASQAGTVGSPSQSAAGSDDPALRSPHPSGDAIEAAFRAQAVTPTDGMLLQSIDWTILTKWPHSLLPETPQLGELTEMSSGHTDRDRKNGAAPAQPILGSASEQPETTDRTSDSSGQGIAVVLPNGSTVPDVHSSTNHLMSPVSDLTPVAGRRPEDASDLPGNVA